MQKDIRAIIDAYMDDYADMGAGNLPFRMTEDDDN